MRHSLPGQPCAQCRWQRPGVSPPPWGTMSILSGDGGLVSSRDSPPPPNISEDGPSPADPQGCSWYGAVALTVRTSRFEHGEVTVAEQRAHRRMSTGDRVQPWAGGTTDTFSGKAETWRGEEESVTTPATEP